MAAKTATATVTGKMQAEMQLLQNENVLLRRQLEEMQVMRNENALLRRQLEGIRGAGKGIDIDTKLMALKEHTAAMQKQYKDSTKPLNKTVDRFKLITDVFGMFEKMQPKNLVRPLRVNFKGEGAVDEGGCNREMFSLFYDQMFSDDSTLFECQEGDASGGSDSVQQSFLPKKGADLSQLHTFGKVMMKSLLTDDIELPQCLPPSFFDCLIDPHKTVPTDVHQALDTLSFFDRDSANSMTRMLEGENFEGMTVADFDGTDNEEQVTRHNVNELIRKKVELTLLEGR